MNNFSINSRFFSAKLKVFSSKLKDFFAKLKDFFPKLKVSENPVTFVAAKWLKKKAALKVNPHSAYQVSGNCFVGLFLFQKHFSSEPVSHFYAILQNFEGECQFFKSG